MVGKGKKQLTHFIRLLQDLLEKLQVAKDESTTKELEAIWEKITPEVSTLETGIKNIGVHFEEIVAKVKAGENWTKREMKKAVKELTVIFPKFVVYLDNELNEVVIYSKGFLGKKFIAKFQIGPSKVVALEVNKKIRGAAVDKTLEDFFKKKSFPILRAHW